MIQLRLWLKAKPTPVFLGFWTLSILFCEPGHCWQRGAGEPILRSRPPMGLPSSTFLPQLSVWVMRVEGCDWVVGRSRRPQGKGREGEEKRESAKSHFALKKEKKRQVGLRYPKGGHMHDCFTELQSFRSGSCEQSCDARNVNGSRQRKKTMPDFRPFGMVVRKLCHIDSFHICGLCWNVSLELLGKVVYWNGDYIKFPGREIGYFVEQTVLFYYLIFLLTTSEDSMFCC